MDKHVRVLGILNALLGAAAILLVPIWLVAAGGIRGIYTSFNDSSFGVVITALALFNLVLAVPTIIGGIFIQRYDEWARTILIITSALHVLNFPVGSALGAYSLWALTTAESEPLFTDPPYPHKRKKTTKKVVDAADERVKAKSARIIPSPSE